MKSESTKHILKVQSLLRRQFLVLRRVCYLFVQFPVTYIILKMGNISQCQYIYRYVGVYRYRGVLHFSRMIPFYLHKLKMQKHIFWITNMMKQNGSCPLFFVRDLVHQVGPETRRNWRYFSVRLSPSPGYTQQLSTYSYLAPHTFPVHPMMHPEPTEN